MKKSYRKPHQFKRKKPLLGRRFFLFGVLIIIFLFSLFYLLIISDIFQVKKIIVTGEDYNPPAASSPSLRERAPKVATEDIKQFIESKLEKRILFFNTKSIFLVNLDEIRRDILNQFPQIAEVEISRGFPDSLNILVIERLALAIWCQGDSCFLTDNEGLIFEKMTEDKSQLLKIQNLAPTKELKLGERIIEKELLSKILEIESELEDSLKISITKTSILSEERLNVETSEGWKIYFNPKEDIKNQILNLSLILEKEIPPEKRADLQYIDLRFGSRVYYKYR